MKDGSVLKAEAYGKMIELFGVTIATLNDKYQIETLETFFNPKTFNKNTIFRS